MIDDADHQKQRRLVKRMHHQKQHHAGNRGGRSNPDIHGQRAQSHQRGIGQNLFYVALAQGQNRGKNGGKAAKNHQRPEPEIGASQRRIHSCHQKHTGFYHGCGMQIGRNRRRRGHGVWQPEMKRKLRRFGKSAGQKQDRNRQIKRISADGIAHGQDHA